MYPVLDSSKEQFKRKTKWFEKKLTKFNISLNKVFTSITRISNIYISNKNITTNIYNRNIQCNYRNRRTDTVNWPEVLILWTMYIFRSCNVAMIYNHTKPTRCTAIRFLSQILTASCSEFIQDTCILNAKTTVQIWIFIF